MRRAFTVLLVALFTLALSCREAIRSFAPPLPAPPPVANTPANAVRLLEWTWEHRDCEALSPLFTEDFVFAFAAADSAGSPYRSDPWTREDELAASCALFEHADDIRLDSDRTLIALPDDRPGRNPIWRKTIRTMVSLEVTADRGGGPEVFEVNGYAKFYLVRGDSAAIPAELVQRGFVPDSTRWWFDRWEDETLPAGGTRAHPTAATSWGRIKVLFR